MKVAVVGAGIHGASTAWSLTRRGHEVTLFEAFELGAGMQPHTMGSSHGRSRIVRKAYADPFYTGIMAEGYDLWSTLQQDAGQTLLHQVGLVTVGAESSAFIKDTIEGLEAVDEPFETYRQACPRARDMRLEADEVAIWTPEAGWVHADQAVAATLALAVGHGSKMQRARVASVAELSRTHDAVVLAPGAWIRDFVPLDVQVTVQTVAYLEGSFQGPVWIEDGDPPAYGFPTVPGEHGFKAALHGGGAAWDVQDVRPGADPVATQLIQDRIARRFGRTGRVVETLTCLYTNTPDEDFRWGRLEDGVFFVSACSGHGFKFGPWIGERMADFVEGKRSPESQPRFLWTGPGSR